MARTILLVEDHAPVRELYADVLAAAGWRVLERPNARGLIRYLLRTPVEVVMLDCTLPGPSGLEALHAIKRHRALRHLRVMVLTAHSTRSLAEAALAAGAERFLEKPLHPQELLDAVDGGSGLRVEGSGPDTRSTPPTASRRRSARFRNSQP
jgi:DNA-binding response OmpR family regulator